VVDAEVVEDPPPGGTVKALSVGTSTTNPPPRAGTDTAGSPPTEHNPADDRLASVHYIRNGVRVTTTQHDVTSGETIDPGAGKHFAGTIRNALQALLVACDQSQSSVTGQGVTGRTPELLGMLVDDLQNGSTHAEQLEAEFDRHIVTRDQVHSNPDLAGTQTGTYLDGARA
jgi:hypothetical protein